MKRIPALLLLAALASLGACVHAAGDRGPRQSPLARNAVVESVEISFANGVSGPSGMAERLQAAILRELSTRRPLALPERPARLSLMITKAELPRNDEKGGFSLALGKLYAHGRLLDGADGSAIGGFTVERDEDPPAFSKASDTEANAIAAVAKAVREAVYGR